MRNILKLLKNEKRAVPLIFSLLVAVPLIFASCSRSPPSIAFCYLKVVYVKDADSVRPGFIFFAMVNDDDGPDDFSELRLYNDDAGLSWQLTADNWTTLDEQGKHWLGSAALRMPSGEALPSGQFRAVIIDKSGATGEKTANFDAPATYRFPALTVDMKDGTYRVSSEYPDNYFLLYYNDGAYKGTLKLTAKSGTLASLKLASDVYHIALWADDDARFTAALVGKVDVRE